MILPQEVSRLPITMPAYEVHAMVLAFSQDDNGSATDRVPTITHPDKEGDDSTLRGVGRLAIASAYCRRRTIRVAQRKKNFCAQVWHGRNNVKAHIALAEITPSRNEHFMRKKPLDISLKPLEQVHMLLDPQGRLGCLHQTDAVVRSCRFPSGNTPWRFHWDNRISFSC